MVFIALELTCQLQSMYLYEHCASWISLQPVIKEAQNLWPHRLSDSSLLCWVHTLLVSTAQQSTEIALLLCRMILCWPTH